MVTVFDQWMVTQMTHPSEPIRLHCKWPEETKGYSYHLTVDWTPPTVSYTTTISSASFGNYYTPTTTSNTYTWVTP